jgi:branched-chain amino acid transport system substrate-binding protein
VTCQRLVELCAEVGDGMEGQIEVSAGLAQGDCIGGVGRYLNGERSQSSKEDRMRVNWLGALVAANVIAAAGSGAARAAELYKIDVIEPMTGGGSFIGMGHQATLEVLKSLVNKEGGINGQPVDFVYRDDQTNPQTAVQLTNAVVGEKPAVLIGSSLVAMCNAMAPLLRDGPFDYCLSPGTHPVPGSFQFSSSVDTHDLIEALVRYFRSQGYTRIAFMTSTDASGQDAEKALDEVLKLPENVGVQAVERQRFNPTDVSVSAQIERIKSSNPRAFIAWATGAPIATVLKAVLQAGLDVPFGTTNGNQTFAQMGQYKDFLPKQLFIPTPVFSRHEGLYELDPRVEAEQQKFYSALAAANMKADITEALSWDPANIIIGALRKLGTKAPAEQVRAYVASQTDLPGIMGVYNFKAVPQRGLTVANAVVTRWDATAQNWLPVSLPSGAPLKK